MDTEPHVVGRTVVPVLDRAGAMERVGGDEALLSELLDMLLEQIASGLPNMSVAIEEGDAHRLERVAHSLKGAAASLGAERFRQSAWGLEQIGRSGDLTTASAALAQLVEEERVLRAELSH